MSSATSTGSPRITLVGAGGMAFGPTMANDVIHTPGLRGATLVLHDVNGARLERAHRFAAKLNCGGQMRISPDGAVGPPPTSCCQRSSDASVWSGPDPESPRRS
jgi:alpha-galactosidase